MNVSEDELKTRHRFGGCVYWNLFILIPLITACIGIARRSIFWMVVYILLSIVVFFVAVYKFFCTHCPHYIEGSGSVRCMFFWGIPKHFKPRPGPYSMPELFVTAVCLLVWVVFPLYWLYLYPGFLAIYVVSLAVLISTLGRYECGRCIHFDCPGNKVPEDVKRRYLEKSPQAE